MSKKKLTLHSDLSGTTHVVGIATSDSEFQISLLINSLLSIKLSLDQSIEKEIKSVKFSFPRFSYITENEEQIYLVKNKDKGSNLINNLSQFDYFVIITSLDEFDTTPLISSLKNDNSVSFVSEIEPGKLANLKSILK